MATKRGKGLSAEMQRAITAAVEAGIKAGIIHAEETAKDAYRKTERRLYAYCTLVEKVAEDCQRLDDLRTDGAQERSKSIVRFSKTGIRVEPEEMLEALMRDLKASIEINQQEISTIEAALESIHADAYYLAVRGKYIDGMTDDAIAESIHCDSSTVRRNRGRLVRKIAIRLYGVAAI